MQNCISGAGIPDTRYLSSPNFISFTLHCLTFLEIPVLSYGAYCILYKTPSRMKSVKLLMLNLHFWSCLSDLVISFVGLPYILLPAPAGYGLGLLDSPQILVYLMVTFIAALTASVLAIYENRFYTLFAQNSWWKKVRKPFLFSIYTLVPLIFLPPYFDLPEQESARQLVLSKIPCQPPFDFKHREIYVLALDYDVPVYCIAFGTLVLGVSITVFGWLIFHMLWFGTLSSSNSIRTLNMQRRFAISLTIQVTHSFSEISKNKFWQFSKISNSGKFFIAPNPP
nr:protein F37B4.6 [imported] - Caenorhabditis elegans [Caenorhabditis elegans]